MDRSATAALPWLVSVDDHLIEPASLWESRLPNKLRARGPCATDSSEGVVWEFDGERIPTSIISAAAGVPLEERTFRAMHWDEIRPGCYDPTERVKDMDLDGVAASLCFPTFPGFGGTRFQMLGDRELGSACIRAYNDFQIEESAGSAPGRLFPMVLLPFWDPSLAVEEIERTAAKGAVAITFTENPSRLGFPSIHDSGRYWDPVWAAAQDAELPICIHFGSSSFVLTTSEDSPLIVGSVAAPLNSQLAFTDWLLSGIFERFPRLPVVLSESYLGWVPFMLEHADRHWANHFAWAMDRKTLPRKPSEVFRRERFGLPGVRPVWGLADREDRRRPGLGRGGLSAPRLPMAQYADGPGRVPRPPVRRGSNQGSAHQRREVVPPDCR